MKTTSLGAALLLLATAVAVLPSAEAAQAPPPCYSIQGCCGLDPGFAPCCAPLSCPPPVARCPPVRVHTSDFLAYMGPHASIDVYSDCSVSVCLDQTGACCVVDGTQSRCSSITASEAAAAPPPGIQPPPQCFTQPCCFAPCPPPCDGCEPDPPRCRTVSVATSDFFAYLGPHAGVALNGDCSVSVWEHGLQCDLSTLATDERTVAYDAGPADVAADVCMPAVDCTCPPIAAAADLPDLPGPPTFPVCVTEPCDAITCDHATDSVAGIRYEFRSNCTVLLDATGLLACPHDWRVEVTETTVGLLTVRTATCSPILDCTCDPVVRID